MAVPSVFISSVVRGFEDVRDQAAVGVERMGMYPIRSERLTAAPASPRRALLDEVASADIYLLLVGERYGDIRPSPTDEEYEEAVRLNRPIFVLVQACELEPEQQAFLDRVRGSWADGALSSTFSGAGDVAAAVAGALGQHQAGIVEDAPAAQEKARRLAAGDEQRGTSGGVAARLALAPLRQTTVLDPEALDQPNLANGLAEALRACGIAPQSIGLDAQISSEGVQLVGNGTDGWVVPQAVIGTDGSVLVAGSVAVSDAPMGFSLVDPGRLDRFIRAAGGFAKTVWDQIDTRAEISQVAVSVAIPEASYKGFGATRGNSMSTPMSLPQTVVAPDPADVIPRGQIADEALARRLVAAVKRIFEDAGALQQ